MKIEFNALGAVSDIITNDEPLRQGNVGANTLTAVFEGKSNLAYTATFNYTRSDDGRLKDIPMTPTANAGEYYYKFSNPWFFAVHGETTLTVYLKNSANEIVASGQITFPIEQTDFDDDPNITYSEYELLLDAITAKQDKFNLNNVRGYDTIELATTDLPNLADGQIVIVKGDNAIFYQVQSGSLVELISDKADKDGDGLVIKSTYGVSVVLSYDSATDTITSKLYASDGTLLDTHSVALPKVTTTINGLMAKEDKIKLNDLPTKGQYDSDMALKVPSTRKILGIDLADDILLGEFKTALGEAIEGVSGLMSATDKARLDALHALLGVEADADAVVSTINEVLAIFNAYPEGADLVSALGGKVDKVAGKGLSENDFTDALKSKLDSLLNGAYYYNKEYIDALKDMNGWSSALLTEVALTNGQTIALATLQQYDIIKLFARDTSTNEIDTDSFDTSVGLVNDYEYRLFDNANIKFVIGATNCTFTDTVGGYELKIIGQKYEAQDAENVNYDKTVKNLLESDDVQGAIDELSDEVLAPAFVDVVQSDLISEITATNEVEIKDKAGTLIKVEGNTPASLEKADLIAQGVKNDSGVLFSELSNEEIEEQLAIWLVQGYPTHINKLISKSDNLFDSNFYDLTDLESENLVANSDLLIPKASPNENQPEGFDMGNLTPISLTNGVVKYVAKQLYSSIYPINHAILFNTNDTYYTYVSCKITDHNTSKWSEKVTIIASPNFQFVSAIGKSNNTTNVIRLTDYRSSDWTPIEIDYMGAINITDLVSRGILPSGLTDAQYKTILDSACNRSHTPMVNVPLRETSLISVEPSTTYKLIKASANTPIHKVVEYATDGQVVKVNTIAYTNNKSTLTTNALTTKIKLVSDLMNRVPNLIPNSDLLIDSNSDGIPDGFSYTNATDITLTNGIAKFTATAKDGRFVKSGAVTIGIKYYQFCRIKSNSNLVRMGGMIANVFHSGSGNFEYLSIVGVAGANAFTVVDGRTSAWTPIEVDYIGAYNITTFINAGVVNDTGTLFSRLTNDEIKEQMDIWVQNGFPDHVVHALYPNGVDSAIAIKYNDADDIFRPQQIDELPLELTLRSGEYWQDGYIIKQNGNAEYYPLSNTFSAWNYGQVQAVYDSGIPADFTFRFASNVAGQVQTTQEYLVEARERLDTLRGNQEQLIKKLGIDVDNDDYDSFVGITSDVYEYYQLEGVKSGNILKVEIAGQSVKNLLVNTIASSITGHGLTITYDDTTGMFTVNGTTTEAGNIILKTGMNFGLPVGTTCQLMRYFDSGTVNLNGSYIGYIISGTGVSNRINENSESLYDPYINGVGDLKPDGANPNVAGTSGQSLIFQVYKAGMVFTDFKFKVALYEGTKLLPFAMPDTNNNTDVDVYNRTANLLDMGDSDIAYSVASGITIGYNALAQEFVISGTATANNTITLKASVLDVVSGDRVSIKRVFQSGDITAVSTLPTIELYDGTSVVLANSIYKMTAPEGETPTPDVSFNTGTIASDGTLTLRLTFKDDDVFDNYRFRLMIHDKSTDIGYVAYNRTFVGRLTAEAHETDSLEFNAIDYGVLEFIPKNDKLNIVYGNTITDTDNSVLEYNAGVQSANRKLSVLESRITALDNPFRDKVIAIWGDSRESNNPTSDPQGVGDQKDTSYPAILAKKLGATVLNFGLSGGAWAENTIQQDAGSAIVNRVLTEDASASADVIIISSMNDFKLHTTLGSPLPSNKDRTTFYGAIRLTFDRLANKYPGKKIWVVLPQKRFDETVNYGGGLYADYRKAQIDVCKEYGIPTIDLYNNFPNSKTTAVSGGVTFYDTNMLNDTHFSAVGNDLVAELVARALIGNGNSGVVDTLPPYPTDDGTYTLKITVTNGVITTSWVAESN